MLLRTWCSRMGKLGGGPFNRRLPVVSTVAGRSFSIARSPFCLSPADVDAQLAEKIRSLIAKDRFVVFLTGTPQQPRCGFTMKIVELFATIGLHEKYSYFDIMSDNDVCEGLKVFADWPTYPQVYIDGELIGGYDVTLRMVKDGSFFKLLKEKQLMPQ